MKEAVALPPRESLKQHLRIGEPQCVTKVGTINELFHMKDRTAPVWVRMGRHRGLYLPSPQPDGSGSTGFVHEDAIITAPGTVYNDGIICARATIGKGVRIMGNYIVDTGAQVGDEALVYGYVSENRRVAAGTMWKGSNDSLAELLHH